MNVSELSTEVYLLSHMSCVDENFSVMEIIF